MEGKTMRRIIYSVCIGSLALALTAGARQVNNRPQRARPQARAANVREARPANTGAMMGARHYNSTAQFRQRAYTAPRTRSNAAMNQNARMQASRERNLARNQEIRARNNAAVHRTRNVDVNRERNVAVNRTRNVEMNRARNADQFRGRNNVAVNRN